jgi:hypothetical protein
MSNYRKTMASALREMHSLDEGKMKDLLIKAQELMGPSKNRKEGIQMVAKGLKVSEKEATKLVDAVIKMNEELAKIKGKTPGDEGRRSAVEDDIERAEKKGDKKEVEKLKEEDEIEEAFSVEVPKQSIDGKTYGGGASVIVKAKSVSHAIKMVAKRLKVDWMALKTGKIVKEEVDESVQRVANAISFHEARKMSPAARARRDALRDIGKDNSKDDDEVKATDADRARADRNIITRFKKIADVSKEFSQKGKFATQYIKRIDPKTGKPEKERSGVTSPGTLKTYKIKFDQGPEKSVDLEDIKLVLALWDSGKLNSSTKLQLQKKMEKSSKDFKDAIDMLKRLLKKLVSKGR